VSICACVVRYESVRPIAAETPRNRISLKADSDQIVPARWYGHLIPLVVPGVSPAVAAVLRRLNYISAMTLMTRILRPSPA
jgi:hypothetical protein